MSGQVPQTGSGVVAGAATLPITGSSDIVVTIAAFVGMFLVTWFVADLLVSRANRG